MTGVPESASLPEDFSVPSCVERSRNECSASPGGEATPTLSLPFIPDQLNDYGLTCDEFRIYCHVVAIVAQKGSCTEPVVKMAQTCRMSLHATNKALKALKEVHKLLIRNKRADSTDEYTLTPLDEWTPPVPRKDRLLDKIKTNKSNKVTNLGLNNPMSKPKGFGSG